MSEHMHAVSCFQQAIGTYNGIESICNRVTATIEQHHQTNVVVTFDIENGYSATSRTKVAELLNKSQSLEHLGGVFLAAYCDTNTVTFNLNDNHVLTKIIKGLVQGDPLAGLYFCLLFGDILKETNEVNSSSNHCLATMFLDDGQLTGTPETILKCLEYLYLKSKNSDSNLLKVNPKHTPFLTPFLTTTEQ